MDSAPIFIAKYRKKVSKCISIFCDTSFFVAIFCDKLLSQNIANGQKLSKFRYFAIKSSRFVLRYLSQTELTLKKISQKHRKLSQAWKIIAKFQLLCDKYRKCKMICDKYRQLSNFCDIYSKNLIFCDIATLSISRNHIIVPIPCGALNMAWYAHTPWLAAVSPHLFSLGQFTSTFSHIYVLLSCCLPGLPATHETEHAHTMSYDIILSQRCEPWLVQRDARWRVSERDAQDGQNVVFETLHHTRTITYAGSNVRNDETQDIMRPYQPAPTRALVWEKWRSKIPVADQKKRRGGFALISILLILILLISMYRKYSGSIDKYR